MRKDLEHIAHLISPNTKILDIGCGEGELLSLLKNNKNIQPHGIEINQEKVSICVQKELNVIQGNADTDLIHYPNKSFDYVIASQMLQATDHPKKVLEEFLRIGKKVIISVPNFGYWYNRFHLSILGRMPVSKTLSYQWYETPNIHFCTMSDLIVLCEEVECKINNMLCLGPHSNTLPYRSHNFIANLLTSTVIIEIEK